MSTHGSTPLHILFNHPFREHYLVEQYIHTTYICTFREHYLVEQYIHTTYICTLLWHYWYITGMCLKLVVHYL